MIWQVPKEGFCETDWLKEVLAGIDFNEIEDGKWSVFKDNSIIIASNDKKKKCKRYYDELAKRKCKFAIIQISDERYAIPDDFYRQATFVLRHYWHENYGKNVTAFPLGYKSGFLRHFSGKELNDASHRKYVWSFAGQIKKSTRGPMIESMKKIPHYHIYETFTFHDPNALSPENYRALLLNTIFVPCPRGWSNLESFRVYEALETGCIPIVEKDSGDYFGKLLGSYPFPSVESWEEAPALIQNLLANPMELEKLRSHCHDWWMEYKKQLKLDIAKVIKESFSD
ncbi:MAG TPA: exostosin family protein [Rhabdochlamydiaceae bacterium]|nr:exostosin family protein [Rhabdochlamydiaceae bacterium]